MSSWLERGHSYLHQNAGEPGHLRDGLPVPLPKLTKSGKPAKPRSGGVLKHTDDEIKVIIRKFRAGVCLEHLQDQTGIWAETIRHWVQGVNRKHLLAEVEAEERKRAKAA